MKYIRYFEKRYFGPRRRKFFRRGGRFIDREKIVGRSSRLVKGAVVGRRRRRKRSLGYFVFAHKKFVLSKYSSMVTLLSSIYGIGYRRSMVLCTRTNFNPFFRPKRIGFKKFLRLKNNLFRSDFVYGRLLSNSIARSIRKFKDSGSYRGRRLIYGLPVRGQRTRTNARSPKKRFRFLGA